MDVHVVHHPLVENVLASLRDPGPGGLSESLFELSFTTTAQFKPKV